MKISASKYFILAVAGALILGVGLYLFLNSQFEKVEIIVAKDYLEKNRVIEPDDIIRVECLKSSLPKGYITDVSEAAGKVLLTDRQPMDPITDAVFKEVSKDRLISALNETEVLIALNIDYVEPVVSELGSGSRISIISSEKEEDILANQNRAQNIPEYLNGNMNGGILVEGSVIDANTFSLSENIMVIDGHVIIKNLEILSIIKPDDKKGRPLAGDSGQQTFIFLKCSIKEAPAIARVTRDNNYKIAAEKS